MKIKDLPPKDSVGGLRVQTPTGVVGLWRSQWAKGVWLSDGESGNIYPQFVEKLADALEWEVVDSTVEINCHIKTSAEDVNNTTDDTHNRYQLVKESLEQDKIKKQEEGNHESS